MLSHDLGNNAVGAHTKETMMYRKGRNIYAIAPLPFLPAHAAWLFQDSLGLWCDGYETKHEFDSINNCFETKYQGLGGAGFGLGLL